MNHSFILKMYLMFGTAVLPDALHHKEKHTHFTDAHMFMFMNVSQVSHSYILDREATVYKNTFAVGAFPVVMSYYILNHNDHVDKVLSLKKIWYVCRIMLRQWQKWKRNFCRAVDIMWQAVLTWKWNYIFFSFLGFWNVWRAKSKDKLQIKWNNMHNAAIYNINY